MKELTIFSLGGVRENGKNTYAVDIDGSIFVLDCGLVYPEEDMLGIDVVIPDFSYLEEQQERIAGIFLTHGHADAVGALPYLLKNIDVPVFGTALTIELAKLAVSDQGLASRTKNFHIIDEQTEIDFGDVVISFFKTTHTIPDSVGIALKTDAGHVVYTGDFRFDQSASELYRTDFGKLTDLGESGVLALLSDSSNAEMTEENASERKIADAVLETFRNETGRIVVACVASNIVRIQQVLDAAYQSHRRVFITGRKLVQTIDVALKLGRLTLPSRKVLGNLEDLNTYDPEKIVILETGESGEPMKMLQKMARGNHPQVNLQEGDLVYIATTPSVAMEMSVAHTKDLIYRAGATVKSISDNVKVSGHASANDLKLMMNLLRPQHVIPVSGEYRMMVANKQLAQEVGIPEEAVFLLNKGDLLTYRNKQMRLANTVPAGNVLIDGIGVGDIGNIVLRDRKILSEDGIFVAVVTISRRLNKILAGPQVLSRGFVHVKSSGELIEESTELIRETVTQHLAQPEFEWSRLRQEVRDALSNFLFTKTKRRPVILAIIMEASQYRRGDHKEE